MRRVRGAGFERLPEPLGLDERGRASSCSAQQAVPARDDTLIHERDIAHIDILGAGGSDPAVP